MTNWLYFSQIECDVRWRPRSGCTQWFTGVTGTLQSYNFAGGKHLANQDYTVCIRQEQTGPLSLVEAHRGCARDHGAAIKTYSSRIPYLGHLCLVVS